VLLECCHIACASGRLAAVALVFHASPAAAGCAAMTARLEDLKPDAQDWGLMGVAPNFLQAP